MVRCIKSMNKLPELLKTWQIAAELPPNFKQQVWRKIEKSNETFNLGNPLNQILASFNQLLTKPVVSYACIAVLIFSGGTLGFLSGRQQTKQSMQKAQHDYLMQVNPFAHE